jgi:hypothetical protein
MPIHDLKVAADDLTAWLCRQPTLDDPCQQRIPWNPEAWAEHGSRWSGIDERAKSGGWSTISRDEVFAVRDSGDPVATFVASMVFGFGDRGYGPTRTSRMLATEDAGDKIREASRILRTQGAGEAHRYLINSAGRLAWCRTAFLSKFLYFEGFGRTPGPQPLILDALVQRSLAEFTTVRLNWTQDYADYCSLVDRVARQGCPTDPCGTVPWTADAIEATLFGVAKRRGRSSAAGRASPS